MYLVHDNGGRPFCVRVNETLKEFSVHTYDDSVSCKTECTCDVVHLDQTQNVQLLLVDPDGMIQDHEHNNNNSVYDSSDHIYDVSVLAPMQYERIFFGENTNTLFPGKYKGNTILVKLKDNSYIWIGVRIFLFRCDDEIISFHSPIGNNDYPYPWALSTTNVFLHNLKDTFVSIKLDSDVGRQFQATANDFGPFYTLYWDDNADQLYASTVMTKVADYTLLQSRLGWDM